MGLHGIHVEEKAFGPAVTSFQELLLRLSVKILISSLVKWARWGSRRPGRGRVLGSAVPLCVSCDLVLLAGEEWLWEGTGDFCRAAVYC